MAFSETFLTTGLPAGRSATQLFLDALISPRLLSDSAAKAALSSWPDLLNWPNVKPTYEVVVEQDGVEYTFIATEVPASPPYDSAAWQQMFPPGQLQQPYRGVDLAKAPIYSYPATAVRDAVRDIHVNALVNSRNEFPTVQSLRDDDLFSCMIEAANPETQAAVVNRQLDGPVADADVECHEAFAMANTFHGGQGSIPNPSITFLTPNPVQNLSDVVVTIHGQRLGSTINVAISLPFVQAVPFTVVSDTEVTFIAPDQPGGAVTATIFLTTTEGDAQATLTYFQPGNPVVTSVSPKLVQTLVPVSNPVDVTVQVTGVNFLAATSVRLSREVPPTDQFPVRSFTINSDTSMTVVVREDTPYRNPVSPPQPQPNNDWYIRVTSPIGESAVGPGSEITIYQNGIA